MNPTVSQIGVLGRVLDAAALRHRVIAQNLANLNTPFYQRLALAQDEGVQAALGTDGSPAVIEGEGGVPRADGNNVSIEREMSSLNKNTLLYNSTVQVLASRLATLRFAISGR